MSDLLATIQRESELVMQFAALLKEEQGALQRGEAAALPGINQRKGTLANEISSMSGLRNALLAGAGCPPERAGMEEWIAKHPADAGVRQAWTILLAQAAEARQLNELNGKLIGIRLQATQEALAILTQQARQASLYGPNGQSSPLTGLRIIDSA